MSSMVSLPGVDINTVQGGASQASPLSIAITNNHREVVTSLLARTELDINLRLGEAGLTALHVACQAGNTAAIEALCRHPLVSVNERTSNGDTPLMLAIIGGHVEAVRRLVAIEQVNLEDLDYRERLNFDNGHIVHSFLTILGIIDEAKQERLRLTLNILRLGSEASDSEEAEEATDGVKDDVRTILHRVERVRADILAKMFDYDEKKEAVDSMKRKHEKEREGLVSRQLRECEAMETRHQYQLRVLQKQQAEERARAERERLGTKRELEELRDSLASQLLEPAPAPAPDPPCPACPVCFESLKPPVRILQCINGHLVCERCRAQPQIEVSQRLQCYITGSLLSVTVFRFAPRAENILWDEPRPWSSIYGFSSNMNREWIMRQYCAMCNVKCFINLKSVPKIYHYKIYRLY